MQCKAVYTQVICQVGLNVNILVLLPVAEVASCERPTRSSPQIAQVADIAAKGQVSFQETLIGIAVVGAVAAAVYLGTKVTERCF